MAEMAPPLTPAPTPTTTPTPLVRQPSAPSPARAYHLRPAFHHRFRSSMVKDCIREVLKEELANVQYNPEEIGAQTKVLSELIRDRLKAWLPVAFGMLIPITTLRMFSSMRVSSVSLLPLAVSSTKCQLQIPRRTAFVLKILKEQDCRLVFLSSLCTCTLMCIYIYVCVYSPLYEI
uniref:Uncharacterized protein n=1 Tax=Naja naja TaxID=35670 RepID=A0A8C7DWB3_NAJNA